MGVDTPQPRLSWVLNDSATRGQKQTGYRVLVATTPQRLREGQADLWDSGQITSDDSVHVEYAGKPLASTQRVFWTVRAWDCDGRPTQWAAPSSWTMGVMSSGDWHAQWIGTPPPPPAPEHAITRASWIWHPEQASTQPGLSAARKFDAPTGRRFFRRAFRIPGGKEIASALLMATADNEAAIELNAETVGQTDAWEVASTFDVSKLLRPGEENLLAITATNGATDPNPAGMVACLAVRFVDGSEFVLASDSSWQSAMAPDAEWKRAVVQAKWGEGPWHSASAGASYPPLPIFRKSFEIPRTAKRAIVHVSGLGHYKLMINGSPARDTVLDAPWSKYERTAYYDTLDVTPHLRRGENVIGVVLARGFYTTVGDRRVNHNQADRPLALRLQTLIEFEDGSTQTVSSDNSWRWTEGPYTHNAILGGPSYDARRLPEGWADAGFDASSWQPAVAVEPGVGELHHSESPPLRLHEEFKPRLIDEPAPGRFVYDFGQNASATVRLKVSGPAGATFRLTYAEQRHGASAHRNDGKGLVNQSGIRSPNYIEYTCRGGGEESWLCDLFYSGFQYIELTGGVPVGHANPENKPFIHELTSVHVRSSADTVGRFATSNEMYGRIDRMIDWSVRSNLSHVLTDCPHREKMGWLEVPHLMWPSIAGRYDLSRLGPKVCRDIRDSQLSNGQIPTVAPSYAVFPGAFQYTPEWGAAGVYIPWYVYQWYGDHRTLSESYDSMRRFVDFMRETADQDLVPVAGLGDWYDYGHGHPMGPSRFTPVELSAMATFHDCAQVVARAANVLGRVRDAERYRQLARQIARGFDKRFYQGNGQYRNSGSPQTANAMALVLGLVDAVDPERRKAVVDAIVTDLEKRGWQQTAGDVGFHYLVRALADNGRSDALYRICNREDLGSYGFLVNAGWTSLPESWDANGSYSLNHCMLGHIQEWFNQDIAAIAPAGEAAAFRVFEVKPTPGPGVTASQGSYASPFGRIETAWDVDETTGEFRLKVVVPVNSIALVRIPGARAEDVVESDIAATDARGVTFVRQDAAGAIFRVDSGTYRFTSRASAVK